MAEIESNEPPIAATIGSPCCYLRSNGAYIFGGERAGTDDDEYSSSACWCSQTMKSFGPDDDMVGHRECRDSSRTCYEPL